MPPGSRRHDARASSGPARSPARADGRGPMPTPGQTASRRRRRGPAPPAATPRTRRSAAARSMSRCQTAWARRHSSERCASRRRAASCRTASGEPEAHHAVARLDPDAATLHRATSPRPRRRHGRPPPAPPRCPQARPAPANTPRRANSSRASRSSSSSVQSIAAVNDRCRSGRVRSCSTAGESRSRATSSLESEKSQAAGSQIDGQRQSVEHLDKLSRRLIVGEAYIEPFRRRAPAAQTPRLPGGGPTEAAVRSDSATATARSRAREDRANAPAAIRAGRRRR